MRIVFLALFFPFTSVVAQNYFPKEWLGDYAGMMYLDFADGNSDSLHFHLHFASTSQPDQWVMRFQFDSAKYPPIVKDYKLIWNEAYSDGGHFIMDEQNGILIDEVLMDDQFVSFYQVGKGVYHSSMQFADNQLYYVLTCANISGGKETKSHPDSDGTVYNVKSWPAFTTQKVSAKKISTSKE